MDAAQFLSGAVLKKSLKRVPVKLMHKSSQRTPRGSLSPLLGQPNSGIPKFGHYDWPKSDISDFGREGWGEGHNLSC